MRRYLLVSHIPFMRDGSSIIVDQLWANDLAELTSHIGSIYLAAPEIPSSQESLKWGPKTVRIDPNLPITFVGLPPMKHSWDLWTRFKICRILKKEVAQADIVHSSNVFNPYLCLLSAHFQAVKQGKKTVFVIAEDYHDSIIWEWVRLSKGCLQAFRRRQTVRHMDRLMKKTAATASLTFLFTPAAVKRFRLFAKNGIAVRDTTHSENDIISEEAFAKKCTEIRSGVPLKLIAACRHKPLKGVEFIVRAVALLKQQNIYVEADLYGHGPLTDELKALAVHLNVSEHVRFPGSLSANQELFETLASHHISLMPHRTNEFARAFYDAIAGGTPVVAFSTAASIGTVRDEVDGVLTPLDNAVGLAVTIERLHRDRDSLIHMSENARHRAFLETRTIWQQFRAHMIEELFWEPHQS